MISSDVCLAMEMLNKRYGQNQCIFVQERLDRAKDDLLRFPKRIGEPEKLANAAFGNSGKLMRNRERFKVHFPVDFGEVLLTEDFDSSVNVIGEEDQADLENTDFIKKSIKNERYRAVILDLYNGKTGEDIAKNKGLTVKSAHRIISRAREQVRKLWEVV